MHIRYILTWALALLTLGTAQAQKRQKGKAKAAPVQVKKEITSADLLYENMLSSIQRVLFIDSIVVDKDNFISHIPLPVDCGTIMNSADFLKTNQPGTAFINEFGNKAYFATLNEEGQSRLMTKDKLQNQWSAGTAVEGIDQSLSPCYPFMMADGITLYFAQQGEDALGGHDIFVTRYDSEDGRFFHPENIGLPFNSKANDYMYIEDELDELGWFVTDRNQPEGKVCIYTFVPSKKRINVDTDEMEDDEIEAVAGIRSIKDSWTDQAEYHAAMDRLQRLRQRSEASHNRQQGDVFYVSDQVAYSSAQQFRSAEARKLYQELLERRSVLQQEEQQLEEMRIAYHEGNAAKRGKMRTQILQKENTTAEQQLAIRQLEKMIRNAELTQLGR